MGIYLPNMEMPKKENIMLLITPDGDVWIVADWPCDDKYTGAKAIPAADVRPVVRGKWKRNERGNYNCSNCKSEHNAVFGFVFCPNCGADMREEN